MNLQTGPDESIRDHLFLHIYKFLSYDFRQFTSKFYNFENITNKF